MGLGADWPELLTRLLAREELSAADAEAAMAAVLAGEATPVQVAGFLVALRAKGVTAREMGGMLVAMLAAAVPLPLDADVIDTCGTGGSEQRREAAFNVSTLAALVAAGAGARVCKHGNRKASATSGSADTLEALGVAIDLDADGVRRCVDEAGIGFCLAPRFHPGMRHAGPVRRELGVRTVFNFLGPLANPATPRRQVVGVSDPAMAETVIGVLKARGAVRAMVVFGHDGLDELTTTTASTVHELRDGDLRRYDVQPAALGLAPATADALRGGDAEVNARLATEVLSGRPGAHRDIVLLNAAAGLVVAGLADDLGAGLAAASAALDDGRAAATLDALVRVSQEAADG
ncbi:MAG TPA: anthranilate phosphoribosyltransferase [Acidimicrobiales bacterium]|nr:anthranilate phosphoribosyltransferase [Acidimicrobiales bacterium]